MGKGLLLLVMAAGIASMTLMYSAQRTAADTDREITGYEKSVIAAEIARSGFNRAVAHARASFASIKSGKESAVAYQEGDYVVEYERLSSGALKVDVVGTYGGERHRISTTLVLASPLDAAIIVEADTATAVFEGDRFMVDGNDTRPPSLSALPSSASQAQDGIKTNLTSVRDEFRTELGVGRIGRVIGKEGDGDIVSGTFSADLQGLYQEAKEKADVDAGSLVQNGKLTGNHTFGSAASPQIVVVPGSVEISGSVGGYGMLVVDGDLTVTGSFEWEGIVMVKKESSMAVDYGGNARIHGSLVVLNGSSVFTMPLDGTLKMTYKYSSAGYQSAVYLHALGADGGNEVVEIFAKGSNRNGDQFGGCCQRAFPQGAQMNFFIRTYASSGTPNVYDHYARGHNAPDGTPYARVTRDAAAKYKWTIEFEDLNVESGHRPDWDYNDQVIEVEVEPAPGAVEESDPFEPWWLVAGVHVREDGSFWSNLAGWFRTSQGRRAGIAVPGEDAPLFRTAMWTVETPAFDDDVPVCKKKNKKKWETEYVSMAQATDWIQSGQAKMGACSGNDGNKKVKVCHVPPGNPSNAHTIEIGMSAVDTHLRNHADYLGECSPTSGGGTTGGGTTGGGETGGGGSTGGGSTGGGSTGGETGGGTTGGGNSANAWATCTANTSGRHLCFRMGSNAEVRYSAQAVARLASRLDRIRESARLVTVDHWVGEQE